MHGTYQPAACERPPPPVISEGRPRWLPAVLTCGIGCGVIFVLVVAASVLMVRGASGNLKEADKVARQFIADVGNGQDKKAYAMASSVWKQQSSLKDFTRIAGQMRSYMGPIKSATQKGNWWQSGTGGVQCTLVYDAVGSKGKGQVTVILVSEGKRLRVNGCGYFPR